jgi:hypothetical protein
MNNYIYLGHLTLCRSLEKCLLYIYASLYQTLQHSVCAICNTVLLMVSSILSIHSIVSAKVSAPLATVITLPPLYTCQSRLLLSNPHCRTASPPSTTHTEVGFDSPLVQWTLPTC